MTVAICLRHPTTLARGPDQTRLFICDHNARVDIAFKGRQPHKSRLGRPFNVLVCLGVSGC